MKKNKIGGLTPADFNTDYKGIYIQSCKDGHPNFTGAKHLVKLLSEMTWKADHMPSEAVALGKVIGKRITGLTFFVLQQSIIRNELRK